MRIVLMTPTETIERECKDGHFTQRSVALSYALAMRDQDIQPVDWPRVNAAITRRWPKGLDRVKKLAWKILNERVTSE